MHIRDTSSLKELEKNTKSKSPVKIGTCAVFAEAITQKQKTLCSYDEEIKELRKEMDLAGDQLEKEPILENFRRFRDILSRLAKRISAEAYQLEKVGGTPHNPRYFEIITIINTEADRLYNFIVQEQKDHMAITAKVIGIKGLVVDLIT